MNVHILDNQNTILNLFLKEIRDKTYQQNKHLFRQNLKRCGQVMAYEISKTLDYKSFVVETPLADKQVMLPTDNLVLVCILRASLPFYHGFLEYFESAESAFIGAFRQEEEGAALDISMDYYAIPKIDGKTILLIDPMLATGKSMVKSIHELLKLGNPGRVIIASLIASEEGLRYVEENVDNGIDVFSASKDPILNDKFYIVPGLGDAGDLAFGVKE